MTKTKKKSLISRNWTIILAFITPIIVLICIYIARGVFPFGDETYLRSDMYHQYAPFMNLFQNILKSGKSLEYSFNVGLGSDFVSLFAYYLASPINWLVAILPSNITPEIMNSFIILKAGLMSATFAYYVMTKFGNKNIIAACFGIFYALSGYMAAYSWNLMWLDCLVLLPLVILGLERLVKENKTLLYTISLGMCVLSNYYIAIMICFFCFFYFIYLMIAEADNENAKDTFRKIGRFILYSVIAGAMGAVLVLPCFFTLLGSASAGSDFPSIIKAYFNLLEMFAHGMMNSKVTMISDGYVPNIYAGIGLFAFVPLFCMNEKIGVAKRIGKSVLIVFMWLGFAINVLAYIWHGFHLPNSLPSRQSFIYIFLVLTVGYEVLLKIKQYKYWQIIVAFVAGLFAIFGLQLLNSNKYTIENAFINGAFLAGYFLLCILYVYVPMKKKKIEDGENSEVKKVHYSSVFYKLYKKIILAIIFALCVTECVINTESTGYSTTSRENYTSDNENINELLELVDDGSFFRVEKLQRRTKNDGAWSNYHSASLFSSTTVKAVSKFYSGMGLQSGTNAYSYYGNTPFTSALLGVKYKLSNKSVDDQLVEYVTGREQVSLYEAKYVLPLGFMVNTNTQAEVNLDGENPFLVQNDFIDAATGSAPIFNVKETKSGDKIILNIEEDSRELIYLENRLSDVTVDTYRDGSLYVSNTYTSLECKMILDLGDFKKGDRLEITTNDEDVATFTILEASLDYDFFDKAMSKFSESPWDITYFSDSYISGEVNVSAGHETLFTTIPYEEGWKVYIDGKETEYTDFYGAFIQVRVPEGCHTIEFKYHSKGLVPGAIISGVALVLFIILSIKKKKKTLKN